MKSLSTFALVGAIVFSCMAEVPRSLGDSQARSVWPKGLESEMNTLVAFRTSFDASAGADVRLDMVAWYSYRVTLNGEFVSFGPARGPKGLFRPDSWKLPTRPGRNELQVEVVRFPTCRKE